MAQDPLRYFRIEARELVDGLGSGAMALEKGEPPRETVARLLRLAHTLKGAARVVKQREIADLAHAVEDALAPYRDGPDAVPRERIDAVLALVDAVEERLSALSPPPAVKAGDVRAAPPAEASRDRGLGAEELDELLLGVVAAHEQASSLRRTLTDLEGAVRLADVVVDHLAPPRGRAAPQPADGRRAETARLASQDLRAVLVSLERGLATGIAAVDRELLQVRDAGERLRFEPASALFTALERVARDTAHLVGRRVEFQGFGGEVRLDAHVLSTMQGALLQLVRNAVAHGIEGAEQRLAAGKPAAGLVRLEVTHRGRRVRFACRDDGRGIDLDAVRRIAASRGVRPEAAARLGPDELVQLLLRGGITTSAAVTEAAGRGIGLDVVRETVAKLGGSVTVRTRADQGTSVEIEVPLSLASVDVLVVEAASATYGLPLDAVRATVRVGPDSLVRSSTGEVLVFERAPVPYEMLPHVLGAPRRGDRGPAARSAVVLRAASGVVAIGVESVHGAADVVLRALPGLAPSAPVVAGAWLDADGVPRLVLDPEVLVAEASRCDAPAAEGAPVRPAVLVIDDSLTTRMLEQSILESAGYEVDTANSGEEALEMAGRRGYALFLVDIEMPGIDGFGFIERVRAEPAGRGVPAILVSSRSSAEDRRRAEAVGANGYVVKSEFDQNQLLDRIKALVG